MKNACTTLIAALLVPTLATADARLWGTWHGDDPDEPGSTVTLTFREDGTYMLAGNLGAGEADLFEDLFGEPLRDTEMTPEDLAALGFQVPHITGVSLGGIYSVWGDSLSLSLRQILMHVEGEEPVEATRFILNVIADLASLDLQDPNQMSQQVFLIVSIAFSLLATEMIVGESYGEEANGFVEESPLMEGRFYFQNEALVIEAEGASDLVLHPIDGLPTTVLSTSWGQVKSRRPQGVAR